MTEYEVVERVPTGLKVAVYHQGKELLRLTVPARSCQTVSLLEDFLRQRVKPEIQALDIPPSMVSLRGKRNLVVR